jgi:hypothetical protein
MRLGVTLLAVLTGKTKLSTINLVEQLGFPLFTSVFAFTYKFLLCFLRRVNGKYEGLNTFLSGFVAGLAFIFNPDPEFRLQFGLNIFARSMDMTITNVAEKKDLKKKDWHSFASL